MVDDKTIIEIEKRLSALEKIVFSQSKQKKWQKKDHGGLRGGIKLLLDNGFFNELRTVKDAFDELKREGYHYPLPSVSKALSVDLTNKQKTLNRVKDKKIWKYVIRK